MSVVDDDGVVFALTRICVEFYTLVHFYIDLYVENAMFSLRLI
jgi:hypothetical protein